MPLGTPISIPMPPRPIPPVPREGMHLIPDAPSPKFNSMTTFCNDFDGRREVNVIWNEAENQNKTKERQVEPWCDVSGKKVLPLFSSTS